MKTQHLTKNDLEKTADIIRDGGLVAIMTDTVYGLAASSENPQEYQHLQDVKERPATKPFPLMVASFEQIEKVAILTPLQRHLMETFMPGAITFIFKRRPDVFEFLGDQDTIGIRMADDPWVHQLIETIGHPIWLPSANKSGLDTATSSKMVLEQLDGDIEGVIIGEIKGGKSSSVFDLTQEEIVCFREGPISIEAVKEECAQWQK